MLTNRRMVQFIPFWAFELMAVSGNGGSFDVSDEPTDDDAIMSNIDRNSGKGNLWEHGW
jgi:hypothetical protein